ncbi:hypothetical protein, partial [Klebsiella variicola]|uniref:hypothetical protein n=1 Tax=Klebsiella variicola TaxID=244366 RepID=UPI0028F841C8
VIFGIIADQHQDLLAHHFYSLWEKGVLDIAWRSAECDPLRMPKTVACASCYRGHVFLVTTTFADIAVWSVTRENSLFQLMTAVCGGKYRGFRRPVCQGC